MGKKKKNEIIIIKGFPFVYAIDIKETKTIFINGRCFKIKRRYKLKNGDFKLIVEEC